MTGDWEESQDLTQDTFHQALKAIDAARAASGEQFHEKAWLLRIAVNNVKMRQRRRGILRFIPFSSLPSRENDSQRAAGDEEIPGAAAVQPAGFGVSASADPAELIAERDAVRRTLARIPETLRECLILAIIGNFSTREIAGMLDLREDAVRQRLLRARKHFQQLYRLESSDSGASMQHSDRQDKAHQIHDERVERHNVEDANSVQRLNLAHLPH